MRTSEEEDYFAARFYAAATGDVPWEEAAATGLHGTAAALVVRSDCFSAVGQGDFGNGEVHAGGRTPADALILFDSAGRACYVGSEAARHVAAADGLHLQGGALLARRPPEARRLQRLIVQTVAAFAAGRQEAASRMLVSRASGRRPYLVTVVAAPRLPASPGGAAVACLVRIQDLAEPPLPDRECLRTVFGLTRRQSALAVELVRTGRLDDAAASCGMAVNTARNHLQGIFAKAGVNSQMQLAQLLARIT